MPTSRVLEEFVVKSPTAEQINEWMEGLELAKYLSNEFLEIAGIRGCWAFDLDEDDPSWRGRIIIFQNEDAPDNIHILSGDKNTEYRLVYTDRFRLNEVTFRKVLHWKEKDSEIKYGIEKGIILHGGKWKSLAISRTFWDRTE